MSFTLRPYQQKFADQIVKLLGSLKQIVACAATGSGKTKTFIYLANRAHSKGFTVLILTEASKIYRQLTGEIPDTGNIEASVKDGFIQPGNVYVGMAQTLARRPKMIAQFQQIAAVGKLLIINDEAHIGTPTKLLQQFIPGAMLIGFTATPDFKFAKHLPLLYQGIVIGPQPDELITDGFLCPYQHFARVSANLDDLKIKNGEFTEESQQAVFESRKVYDGLITDLSTMPYRKAVIFTSSIKHCDDTFNELHAAGITCIRVHSKVHAAEQSYDMAQFIDGPINICVSVGILTKGWDFPAIDLVILQRATTSRPLYLQMIGRGSRTSPGKSTFTVLDYGGNYTRHGLWDAAVDWGKLWNTAPKKKDGVAPVKNCPECDYINPVSVTVCRNCGYNWQPLEPTREDQEQTKLIELTAAYRTLIGRKISSLQPHELAMYARLKNKKPFAARVAKAITQQVNPEYLEQYGAAMGYNSGWLWHATPKAGAEKIEFTDITLR